MISIYIGKQSFISALKKKIVSCQEYLDILSSEEVFIENKQKILFEAKQNKQKEFENFPWWKRLWISVTEEQNPFWILVDDEMKKYLDLETDLILIRSKKSKEVSEINSLEEKIDWINSFDEYKTFQVTYDEIQI